jgi:hypothetical protein
VRRNGKTSLIRRRALPFVAKRQLVPAMSAPPSFGLPLETYIVSRLPHRCCQNRTLGRIQYFLIHALIANGTSRPLDRKSKWQNSKFATTTPHTSG